LIFRIDTVLFGKLSLLLRPGPTALALLGKDLASLGWRPSQELETAGLFPFSRENFA
jgi:hypothetical protein